MEKIYLVTGAAGHLGRNVVQKLTNMGAHVRILVLPGEKNIPQGENIEVFEGDVTDVSSLDKFFDCKNATVIHCAGIVSISSKYDDLVRRVNVDGTKNVVTMCEKYNVDKLVHVSSVHAIPELPKGQIITEVGHFDPDDVFGQYAKTKAMASQYVLDHSKNINASIVHPSGITGPMDYGRGHITQLVIDFAKDRLPFVVNGGYDFVDARDVADGIVSCAIKGRTGECYILSNEYFLVDEIVEMMGNVMDKPSDKIAIPKFIVNLAAPVVETFCELANRPPLFTSYSMHTLDANAIFSHEKATAELGYNPGPMQKTIRDTYNWLKAKGRIDKYH